MDIGWQLHPSTQTAHAFVKNSKPGDLSFCKRDSRCTGDLIKDPGVFPCRICLKKLNPT